VRSKLSSESTDKHLEDEEEYHAQVDDLVFHQLDDFEKHSDLGVVLFNQVKGFDDR
jgi:hypothetical protein